MNAKSQKKVIFTVFFLLVSTFVVNAQTIQSQWQKKGKVHTDRSWSQLMNDPTVNFYDVQATFYDWYDKTKPKHGIKAFKRWEAFMEPRVYPTGDRTKMTDVYAEYEKFKQKYSSKSTNGNWSFIGPTIIAGEIQNGAYKSPGGNGRINCIAFDPNFDGNTNQTLWVGTPAGGLWKTENNGKTWSSPGQISIGVSEIIIDPNNTNNMWVGTGDNDAGDTYSSGILKTTNGGATWVATAFAVSPSNHYRVKRLLASPANVNTQIAFCNGVTYRTTDGWSNKSTIASLGGIIDDAEFKPGTNGATVYASKTNANAAELWRSTDGGATFTQVGNGLPAANVERISIAVSASQPNYVWALVGRSDNQGLLGIYRSTDSGANFNRLYDGTAANHNLLGWATDFSDAGGQAFYDLSIQVNPSDANEVFVGGVNLAKSTNSGSAWVCNGYWLKGKPGYEYIHADHHALEYSPNGWIYDGCDGGIFMSKDNGSSWTDISNNLGIAQVARIGASSTNPRLVLAGMQDNGSNKFSNETWTVIKGGDGCEQIVDPVDNNTIFSSYVQGKIYKSTDAGSSWTTVLDAGGGWITPFVMDPTDHTIMYSASYSASSKKLQKSTDNGSSWSAKASYNPAATTYPKWISVSKSDNSYVYIVSSDQVWRSINSGTSMSGCNGDLFSAPNNVTASISSIEVSPADKDYIVVTLSGYNAGEKVFRSTNGGTNWTNISSNLPNIPVNVVVFEEGNANKRIFVGTDNGVYYKDATNTNGNWTLYDTGLPQTSIHDMEIYYGATYCDNRLRAATYGRSIWESDLPGGGVVTYNSSEVIQPNTTDVNIGDVSQEIIGIKISMSNCGDPVAITDFQLNTNGTTDAPGDIENARIYYTGSVGSFQPIQQFGSTVANPNGNFTISGSQNLAGGDNYFWLAYDIKSSATGGHLVDGECTQITIGGANYTPSTTAPTGNRKIITCSHCYSYGNTTYGTSITLVDFNTINNSSAKPTDGNGNAYSDYTSKSTDVNIGDTYDLTVNLNTDGNYEIATKVWIDWNHNCSFTDAGEEYDLGTAKNETDGATSASPLSITVPGGALSGTTIMRVSCKYNVAPTSCETAFDGEVEDYTINVLSACSYPSTQASNLSFTPHETSLDLTWTNGNGDKVLVVAHKSAVVDADPVDGTTYSASATFGSGTEIGTGNYVVYDGTSTSVTVTGLTANTSYYFAVYSYNSAGHCYKVPAHTGNKLTLPAQPSTISGSTTPCEGSSQTYSVTNVSGITYNWTFPSGWTQTAGGTTNSVTVTVGSTSGNVEVVPSNASGNGTSRTLAVTVNPQPEAATSVSATSTTICDGSSTDLTYTGGSGTTFEWYSSSCGGTSVGSGNNLTVSPTSTTTYYGRWENSCQNSNCLSVTITVDPTTVGGSVTGGTTICSGSTSGTLTLSGYTGSIVKWQYSTNSGSSWTDISNTSTTYTSSALTQTTWFRAVVQSGTCSVENSNYTVVTVNPQPVAATSVSASSTTICDGSSTTLSYSGGSGDTFEWYTGSCGGTSAGSGNNLSVSPSTTTTYYGRWENSCGNSTCKTVTITVNPQPVAATSVSASPTSVSAGGTSTLSYSGGSGDTFEWYSGSCGGTSVGSGNNLSVTVNSTTTYYGRWENSCGASSCQSVTVTVTGATGHTISGTVKYVNTAQTVINGETVNLLDNGGSTIATTTTNASGYYEFTGVADGDYTVSPGITLTWKEATAMDVTLYKKHILGESALTGLKLTSGDVDNSGTLNTIDLTTDLRRIVTIINSFTAGDWAYTSGAVTLSGADKTVDIQTICYGDANTSYFGAKSLQDIVINKEGSIYVTNGDYFELPVIIKNNLTDLASVTLEIPYNTNNFDVTDIDFAVNNSNMFYHIDNGVIRIAYSTTDATNFVSGDNLFIIKGYVQNLTDDATLSISANGEFGDYDNNVLTGIMLSAPTVKNSVTKIQGAENDVFMYPNPAETFVNILNVKDSKIEIVDILGKVVVSQNSDQYTAVVNIADLKSGAYIVRIHKDNQVILKKLTIVK